MTCFGFIFQHLLVNGGFRVRWPRLLWVLQVWWWIRIFVWTTLIIFWHLIISEVMILFLIWICLLLILLNCRSIVWVPWSLCWLDKLDRAEVLLCLMLLRRVIDVKPRSLVQHCLLGATISHRASLIIVLNFWRALLIKLIYLLTLSHFKATFIWIYLWTSLANRFNIIIVVVVWIILEGILQVRPQPNWWNASCHLVFVYAFNDTLI